MTGYPPGAARLLGLGEAPLVLASASPRRAELLRALGVAFTVQPVGVDERVEAGEDAGAAAVRLAQDKARAAASAGTPRDAIIVAADTLVILDGRALGKPRDDEEARDMLRGLSGREHVVATGVAVLRAADGKMRADLERTRVRFRDLEAGEVEILVASGEARDKAGAYGIQGLAGLAVEGIEGDYFNVVGLPLGLLRRLLHDLRRTS